MDGIVKAEVNQHSGADNITFSQDNSPSGIYQNNKLVSVTKEYYNTTLINVSKLFPKGYIEIRLILKVLASKELPESGYFDIKYQYTKEDTAQNKHIAHEILRNNENPNLVYIDTSHETQNQKEKLHSFSISFDDPIQIPPTQNK